MSDLKPPTQNRPGAAPSRSEEHTSELQSHSDLVCRLLLEKKKNTWSGFRRDSLEARTVDFVADAQGLDLALRLEEAAAARTGATLPDQRATDGTAVNSASV